MSPMFSAILQFILFAAIVGGIGYFIFKRTPIVSDFKDDFPEVSKDIEDHLHP